MKNVVCRASMIWRERFDIALQSLAIFTSVFAGLALACGLLYLVYKGLF